MRIVLFRFFLHCSDNNFIFSLFVEFLPGFRFVSFCFFFFVFENAFYCWVFLLAIFPLPFSFSLFLSHFFLHNHSLVFITSSLPKILLFCCHFISHSFRLRFFLCKFFRVSLLGHLLSWFVHVFSICLPNIHYFCISHSQLSLFRVPFMLLRNYNRFFRIQFIAFRYASDFIIILPLSFLYLFFFFILSVHIVSSLYFAMTLHDSAYTAYFYCALCTQNHNA